MGMGDDGKGENMSADRSPYLFTRYMSRKQYLEQTGKEAPPFNPARDLKNWEDPAASGKFGKIVYPYTLGTDETGALLRDNGAPVLYPLVLTVDEARTVNLPDEDAAGNTSIQPGTRTVQCPIDVPGPGEALVFGDSPFTADAVWIRNLAAYAAEQAAQTEEAGKFTPADRAMLVAIAKKVGV